MASPRRMKAGAEMTDRKPTEACLRVARLIWYDDELPQEGVDAALALQDAMQEVALEEITKHFATLTAEATRMVAAHEARHHAPATCPTCGSASPATRLNGCILSLDNTCDPFHDSAWIRTPPPAPVRDKPDHAAALRRASSELSDMGDETEAYHYAAGADAIERLAEAERERDEAREQERNRWHEVRLYQDRNLELLAERDHLSAEIDLARKTIDAWKDAAKLRDQIDVSTEAELSSLRAAYDKLRKDALVCAGSIAICYEPCDHISCPAARRIREGRE